ncbi:hypothetical protein [Nocardioides sp. LS1]|uniref:hypothetical protein n=1 Tax=Nocardioides sp. LS1 TaxID=1027620 RepID=UPI000F6288DF|nr:hypothetical protein [Nocardioides sp. LS1]GCD88761.1 hypothetical protein NLS1_07670 [Nocardioides sp. LS1]
MGREDLRWWWDLAPTLKWRFAKSMPDVPHWYVRGGTTPGFTRDDSLRVARLVRTFGEPGKFYRATNLYLYTPDRVRKVWCMFGDPIREDKVRIVNLAFADQVYGPQENFDQARLDALALPPDRLSSPMVDWLSRDLYDEMPEGLPDLDPEDDQ